MTEKELTRLQCLDFWVLGFESGTRHFGETPFDCEHPAMAEFDAAFEAWFTVKHPVRPISESDAIRMFESEVAARGIKR